MHGFQSTACMRTRRTAAAAATATPEMLKLAKKLKLQPAWLLDPAAPALLESNAALDTEKTRLQGAAAPFVAQGREVPPALDAKLSEITEKILYLI